ncbi:hypothetical protein CEXT_572331 [Caerostris extrusa]|uniref:Uncharacterized protein n=1 Tax=Caerostris extrusa TaxID=172846 RepID=A0AAV4W8K3_CAEEX|nr:hypothetical protein CEXT_572331 [Caerostris extrusa]
MQHKEAGSLDITPIEMLVYNCIMRETHKIYASIPPLSSCPTERHVSVAYTPGVSCQGKWINTYCWGPLCQLSPTVEFDIAQSVFSVRQEQRERIPPPCSLSNRTIPSPAITERPQMGWGEWRAGSLRMGRMFCLPC